MLRSLREKLRQMLRDGGAMVDDICASLEQCCAHFYRRLAREEELVQIAERVIPAEEWFGIAAGFLIEDGRALALREPVHDEEEWRPVQAPTQGSPALHQPPTLLRWPAASRSPSKPSRMS